MSGRVSSALPWVLWALWALMALLERRTWACVPAPWELGACGLNKGKGSESLGVCAPAGETGLGGPVPPPHGAWGLPRCLWGLSSGDPDGGLRSV